MSLWQSFLLVLEIFFFLAYLIVLFQIVGDLFRDRKLGGVAKALWVVLLIVVPLLTALVYLVARGKGMAERSHATAVAHQEAANSYIREVAGTSPSQEIAAAKALLDAGTITAEQFDRIKARALESV